MSVPVAATVAWVVVAWSRLGPGVALSVAAPAVAVGVALGVGWLLMRRAAGAPSVGRPVGAWPPPVAARESRPAAVPSPPAGAPAPPDRPLPPLTALPSLSTAQLCWAWRRSYVHLGRCVSAEGLAELADLRRGYLDELQRRDPAAFARWFPAARAASDPARFFCPVRAEHRPAPGYARAAHEVRTPSSG